MRLVRAGSLLVALVVLGALLYSATLVDRRPPSITRIWLSAPSGTDERLGQTVTSINVEFSEPVRRTSVRIRIEPHVAGAVSWDGETTAIFTPAAKLPPDTEFHVTVEAGFTDLAGNAAPDGIADWAFRTVGPPVVVEASPADGARDVPVDTVVELRFDRLMDTRSVEAAIAVAPAVAYRPAWSGETLTLVFDHPLAYGTEYTVSIGPAARDTDGTAIRDPVRIRFTTVRAGLGVVRLVPAPGVSGVSVRTPIAVVFDAPIDPASVGDALRIVPGVAGTVEAVPVPGDGPVVAGAEPPPSRMLRFVPSGPLAPSTTYTVGLEPVVRAAGGSADVAAARSWTFTTGAPGRTLQNQIAFYSARSGVPNVWLMNPDGSNTRQLTAEVVPVSGFDVAGDGSVAVYSAAGVVRAIRPDGSDAGTLTAGDLAEYAPLLAPDGRSVVVGRRRRDGTDLGYWRVTLPGVLPIEERRILPDGAPPLGSTALEGDGIDPGTGVTPWGGRGAFSSDGRWLLLARGAGELVLVDLAADPVAARSVGIVAAAPPAWSDRSLAFFVAGRRAGDSRTTLYRVPLAGEPEPLGPADWVAVGPTGALATLGRDADGDPSHVRFAATPLASPSRLTSVENLADRAPSFSPDGRTIVFFRVPADAPTRSAGIWLVDPVTRDLRQLTTDGAYPRWLP